MEDKEKETIMTFTHSINEEQTALWNGPAGRAWVETQESIDQMFKPFQDLLIETIPSGFGGQVLDVGCGTGSTTLAAARRLGARGRCTGIDISEPMLALARSRAEQEGTPANFLRADAQIYAFEPASFDHIISRFGVMFFEDSVGAFANLRRAAREGAELRFQAWRSAAENPFMTTGERAAGPMLPNLPPRIPDAPGQFAFADQQRLHAILEESGWVEIDIRPLDVTCIFPEKDLVSYLTRLGPVGMILQDADAETRNEVIETIRAAFDPYVHGDEVRFNAACWMVSARVAADRRDD
jgi:SAM-dependent methyltransferase